MKVDILMHEDNWLKVKAAALNTIGKKPKKMPDSEWKRRILLSEHSPIRLLKVMWKWISLKYWISVHFVRHKYGIEHWVSTQRPDTLGQTYDRDAIPQGAGVDHMCEADAQAIIYISRKRLCNKAHPKTRQAWQLFLDEIEPYEQELISVCAKECVYRNGLCPEFNPCGYNHTEAFEQELRRYIDGIEANINSNCRIN